MADQNAHRIIDPEIIDDERALTVSGLFPNATMIDDSPLWLAWETARQAWLDAKERKSGRKNTRLTYETAHRQFFDFCGIEPWRITSAVAQNWARDMRERGLSDSTVGLKLAALSSFYEFCQVRYVIPTRNGEVTLWPVDRANPFKVVERPAINPYGKAKFPNVEELQAILGAINTEHVYGKRDFALLYTTMTTCRRFSEIVNLKRGDIQPLDDGNYSFRYIYKGGKIRKAKLHRTAMQAIRAYLDADGRPFNEMADDQYIFVAINPDRILRLRPDAVVDPNTPLSNTMANGILKKYGRRAGVDLEKCHIHGLRHAGARLRVKQMKEQRGGVDYVELMQLLGHGNLAVTQIYSAEVLEDPEDPGADAAADALLRGAKRRGRKPKPPKPEQGDLGI